MGTVERECQIQCLGPDLAGSPFLCDPSAYGAGSALAQTEQTLVLPLYCDLDVNWENWSIIT